MRYENVIFRQRAERGTARGAEEVLARARDDATREMGADGSEGWVQVADPADLTVVDFHRLDESATPAPRKRRAAVLAVAAAVLVVIGVVVVPDQNDRKLETETGASATTPDAVPSPTPPPQEGAGPPAAFVESLGYRWSRVANESVKFNSRIRGVTVGGPGLVAVGHSGEGTAAVWTSVDGVTWSRVPHDEAVFGDAGEIDAGAGGIGMESVTVGGPGFVAVGGPDWWDTGDQNAVVWTSVDGVTWSRVPDDEAVFGGTGPQRMMSVTAGGPGLVAVGYDEFFQDSEAVVWTSVDGVTWSRVPHDEAVFGGGYMTSVTAGGPGLVAVGTGASDTDGDAAVWTSVDGVTWSRVPHDNAIFGGQGEQQMWSVTAGGPGVVVVGMEGYCDSSECMPSPNGYVPAVWTSVDGITWSRVPHDEDVFGEANSVQSVTAGGPGLVAVGSGGVIVAEPMAAPED